jgi:hypothetical protein
LAAGDIITIAGVNAVNRTSYQSLGTLCQFVVTAAAAANAVSLSIYPPIIPPANATPYAGLPYTPQQYQTVTASPANSATILLIGPPATTYIKNVAFDTTVGTGHAGFTNVTPGSDDFHLKAGSALLAVGTSLSGTFTGDIDGETRPTNWSGYSPASQRTPW